MHILAGIRGIFILCLSLQQASSVTLNIDKSLQTKIWSSAGLVFGHLYVELCILEFWFSVSGGRDGSSEKFRAAFRPGSWDMMRIYIQIPP